MKRFVREFPYLPLFGWTIGCAISNGPNGLFFGCLMAIGFVISLIVTFARVLKARATYGSLPSLDQFFPKGMNRKSIDFSLGMILLTTEAVSKIPGYENWSISHLVFLKDCWEQQCMTVLRDDEFYPMSGKRTKDDLIELVVATCKYGPKETMLTAEVLLTPNGSEKKEHVSHSFIIHLSILERFREILIREGNCCDGVFRVTQSFPYEPVVVVKCDQKWPTVGSIGDTVVMSLSHGEWKVGKFAKEVGS